MKEQIDLRKKEVTDAIKAEELARRRQAFLDRGFSAEWIDHLSELKPTLYSSEILETNLIGLQNIGFSNPIKLIESLPSILGISLEGNIKPKIEGLGLLGFTNPHKMIESVPSILGYNLEGNIKKRFKLIDRVIKRYGLPFTTSFLMENVHFLFSSKIDKIVILIRVFSKFAKHGNDANTKVF